MDNAEMDEFVGRVREQSDIHAVISRYVPLTMKNGRYWACCPFHNENTASFSVIPDKGIFYCFGCHVGGNVFKFISLIENVSYFDAVKLQAERLGIRLPSEKKRTPEEIKRAQEQKYLLKACEFAGEFYHDRLIKTAEGESGRNYLKSRGITPETIDKFKIGIAPDSWDGLIDEMTKRGFQIDKLIEAGLVLRNKSDTGFYDRFRGRVIIPIHDIFGRIVAFGGRTLHDADKNNPKYLNSPETAIFKKGNLLFGLDKAHQEISRTNTAVVVEGYMDAISLVSAGIKNVVASLGTAFTANHAKLLARYARKIILCYDNDTAGQRATMRALPIVREAGSEVFVAKVPDGKDPDDFIRKHGKDAFEELLKNSASFIDYTLNYFLNNMDHSTIGGKMQILKEILPLIANVNNSVLENDYRKRLANDLSIDESTILNELSNVRKQISRNGNSPQTYRNVFRNITPAEDSALYKAGERILQTIWDSNDMLGYVDALIPKGAFIEIHQEIIDYIRKCVDEERHPDEISAAAELSDEANNEMMRILSGRMNIPDRYATRAFNDAINRMRFATLKNEYDRFLGDAKGSFFSDVGKFNESLDAAGNVRKQIDTINVARALAN